MIRFRQLLAHGRSLLLGAGVWGLLSSPAMAEDGRSGSSQYVGAYAVTLLLVTLGILVVCHSGNRADEPRASRFDDE